MPATPSNTDPLTRRGFLGLAWRTVLALSGLLGLGGLLRLLAYTPDPPPPSSFVLDPAESYPPGSHTLIPEAKAVLFHGEDGFSALSLTCPHLGCQVGLEGSGSELEFACPCHGSRFDGKGNLVRGPASQGLTKLEVKVMEDGRVWIGEKKQ